MNTSNLTIKVNKKSAWQALLSMIGISLLSSFARLLYLADVFGFFRKCFCFIKGEKGFLFF